MPMVCTLICSELVQALVSSVIVDALSPKPTTIARSSTGVSPAKLIEKV